MSEEQWIEIPGYPDYAVSSEGRVWNLKLNKELLGHPVGRTKKYTIKNQQGGWDTYSLDQILNGVDFGSELEPIRMRKIRVVETGEVFDNVEAVRAGLLADKSTIYKVLRGQLRHVAGVSLEYFYE